MRTTSPRSERELVQESDELLKDCVDMTHALLACPSLTDQAIKKAALYGAVRTPRRGLYYIPDLKVLEASQWKGVES